MPKNGEKAISGILERIKDRPDNNIVNNISGRDNCDWDDNWDNGWENDTDTGWEDNTWD